MAKKIKKLSAPEPPQKPAAGQEISSRGWKVIALGIGVLILGFYLLTLTDPSVRNWASRLCPFVILGGYALIAVGIVTPEPSASAKNPAQSPPPLGTP